jgi:hypothetical protein
MKIHYALLTSILAAMSLTPAKATDLDSIMMMQPPPVKKFYLSSGLDAGIFSVSRVSANSGASYDLSRLRFSYVLNFGMHANYDFSSHFGAFTGLGIKNIGFIEKVPAIGKDVTVKRRVYTIGAPIGLKFGNLQKKTYGFIGGGVDVPFNYKEKRFTSRSNKTKFNEWFSDRTPVVMPYVFAGMSLKPGMTLKLQYYPGNFFNTDYSEQVAGFPGPITVKPYATSEVNMMQLTLGMDMRYSKKHNKAVREKYMQRMKDKKKTM